MSDASNISGVDFYANKDDQTNCNLLRKLPSELRNLIFEQMLKVEGVSAMTWRIRSGRKEILTPKPKSDRDIWAGTVMRMPGSLDPPEKTKYKKTVVWENDGKPKAPPILFVCKEMTEQMIRMFFSNVRFNFPTYLTFCPWVKRTSEPKLKLYKNLYFNGVHCSYENLKDLKRRFEDKKFRN